MGIVWQCGRTTTETCANLSVTIGRSRVSTFGGLIKRTSEVLRPISVDDDLIYLVVVVVGVVSGSVTCANMIALQGISNCGGIGRRVGADSLNEASPVDFEASEPGGPF